LVNLRPCVNEFFSTGPTSNAILNCYRLAKFYSRHPNEFLALPLDEVERHIQWTDRMLAASETVRQRDGW
jgi:hypothetical protein